MSKDNEQSQPIEHPAIEKIVLLMVSGLNKDSLRDAAIQKLAVPPEQAVAFIAEAKRRLNVAAKYDPDEKLGEAMTRLNDIYARSLKAQDMKTALAAQREIDRIVGLYGLQGASAASSESEGSNTELEAIASHLRPLNLAPDDYPLPEVARIAADRIREAE